MTDTPLTKAEREELRAISSSGWTGVVDVAALMTRVSSLLADLDAAEAERDTRGDEARELRSVLLRHNFAPCDTAACNCNGWHERSTGNGFYARFREIEEAVGDHNGKTLLKAVQEIVAQRDRAESERDALKAQLDEANENLAKSVVVLAKSNKTRDDARKSLESLRNAINSFDGADSAREVKAPVGRAIGIIADQRAEIVALKAKLDIEHRRMRNILSKLREELGADLGCGGGFVEILTGIDGLREQRDDAKAKLAALLRTATDLREVAFDGPSEPKGAGCHGGLEGLFDWKERINRESAAAIAAARGAES